MMRKIILLPRLFASVLGSEFERFAGRAFGVCALQRRLQGDSRRSCVYHLSAFLFESWSWRTTTTCGPHREYDRGSSSCCVLKTFPSESAGAVS